jgi:lysyl-tRNA synthetase class I
LTLPVTAKTFVPVDLPMPMPNHSPPRSHDLGQVGQRLDVVDHRRLAPQALDRRVRRPRRRRAALAFERCDEGGFLAAHERPGAESDLDVEAEVGAQDVVAQQAGGLAWRIAFSMRWMASGYSARM